MRIHSKKRQLTLFKINYTVSKEKRTNLNSSLYSGSTKSFIQMGKTLISCFTKNIIDKKFCNSP